MPAGETGYKWRLVALLFGVAMLNYADRTAITTVFPLLRSDLKMTDVELGAVGSFFLWAYALASPLAGSLADRMSRSRLIVGSLAAWSLITLASGLAATTWQLLVLRALLGFAEALYLPAAIALIADYHPVTTRATAISIHTAGLSFGLVAGGTATGYLGESFGWRPAFFLLGGAGLLMAVAAWWWVRDAAEPRELSPKESPSAVASMVSLMRIPSYAILMAQAMLVAVANWIFVNWLPLYFKEAHSMSLGAAGFTGTFMMQGAATVGVLAGGVLSDRYAGHQPRRRMLLQSVCCFVAAPFLLAFLVQPGIAILNLSIFVFAFFKRIGSTNELPIVCDLLEPRLRSTAIGMMNATNCASGGVGILIAGALKSTLGLDGIFGGLSLLMVLSGLITLAGYLYFFERDLRLSATGRLQPAPVPAAAPQAN